MEKRTKRILSMLATPVILLVVLAGVAAATNLILLPQTGQTKCYDAQGTELSSCANTGQDGEIRAGVTWPSPRFVDNTDGTMTDLLTGLVWLKDADCFGKQSWTSALDKVADFNVHPENYVCKDYKPGTYNWRLSNINELNSLVNAGEPYPNGWLVSQGFVNVQYDWYWSSTTNAAYPDTTAWTMSMMVGWINEGQDKSTGQIYVWPVAKGQFVVPDPSYPVNIQQTGQRAVYYPGDDGSIQAGVQEPVDRFTKNVDGTTTDTLTGLTWMKDTSSPTVGTCSIGARSWQEALDYARCLNFNSYLSHINWRLPNREELHSLMNYSQYKPALSLGYPFDNLQLDLPNYWFWTSTSVSNPSYGNAVAWQGNIVSGSLGGNWKTNEANYPYYAWLVSGDPSQNPKKPTGLGQFKSDKITAITTGDTTDERTVIFKATVKDPNNDKVKLQIELRKLDEYSGQFDENQPGLKTSALVPSGSQAIISVSGLMDGRYHWRARAIDEHNNYGDWQDYGDNDISAADFVVSGPPVIHVQVDPSIEGATLRVSVYKVITGGIVQTTSSCEESVKTNKDGQADIPTYKSATGPVVYAFGGGSCQKIDLKNAYFMATFNIGRGDKLDPKDIAYARLGLYSVKQAQLSWEQNKPIECNSWGSYDSACNLPGSAINALKQSSINLYLYPPSIKRYMATSEDNVQVLSYLETAAKDFSIAYKEKNTKNSINVPVPLPVLTAIISVESGCDWTSSGSCAGAQWDGHGWTLVTFDTGIGAMQLTGATATEVAHSMGIEPDSGEDSLSANFNNNIRGGTKYLRSLFMGGKSESMDNPGLISNWYCSIMRYNAGPGASCKDPTKYFTDTVNQIVPFYYDDSKKWYVEDGSLNSGKAYVTLSTLWKTTCGIRDIDGKNLWVCQ